MFKDRGAQEASDALAAIEQRRASGVVVEPGEVKRAGGTLARAR
jgi:hypothetical protein